MSIEWKDATSYSQGERGKIEPTGWETTVSGVRVLVTKGHVAYRGTWIMNCHELGLKERQIGHAEVMGATEAQVRALKLCQGFSQKKAQTLLSFASEVEENVK